jgi:hypothetical protein
VGGDMLPNDLDNSLTGSEEEGMAWLSCANAVLTTPQQACAVNCVALLHRGTSAGPSLLVYQTTM